MKHAERLARGRREGHPKSGEGSRRAERRQPHVRPQRHVDRTSRIVATSPAMRETTAARAGFAPGADARTTPLAASQTELELSSSSPHLNRQLLYQSSNRVKLCERRMVGQSAAAAFQLAPVPRRLEPQNVVDLQAELATA
jgi:hypothetical protein